MKKCGVLIMEKGKVIRTDGIKLPDGQYMKDINEAGYIYLEILQWKLIRSERKNRKKSLAENICDG